ncbi:hypothetical protein [Streptacidiphilus sp. PAMC 29251]
MPSMIPSIDIPEPTGTAAGCCHRCGSWGPAKRIVREVHSDSGAGGTVVACAGKCKRKVPPSTTTRTYSL